MTDRSTGCSFVRSSVPDSGRGVAPERQARYTRPCNAPRVTDLVESERDMTTRARNGAFGSRRRGAAELATWLRTPPDLTSPPGRVGHQSAGRAVQPPVSMCVWCRCTRRYVVELVQQWARLKDGAAEHEVSFLLVVDAELFRLDSVIRWLDAADGRLARLAADPPPPGPALAGPVASTLGGAAMTALELRERVQGVRRRSERGARLAWRRPLGRNRLASAR